MEMTPTPDFVEVEGDVGMVKFTLRVTQSEELPLDIFVELETTAGSAGINKSD